MLMMEIVDSVPNPEAKAFSGAFGIFSLIAGLSTGATLDFFFVFLFVR